MEVQHTRTLNQNFQGYVLGNYIFLKLPSVILIQAKSNALILCGPQNNCLYQNYL